MKKLVFIVALALAANAAQAQTYYTRPNLTGGGYGVYQQGGGYVGQVVPNFGAQGSTVYGANGQNEGQIANGPFSLPGIPGLPGIPSPY